MSEQNPEQGSLFEITDTFKHGPAINPESYTGAKTESTFEPSKDGVFHTSDSSQPEADTSYDGPYVNILERNRKVVQALGTLASISKASGLEKANNFSELRVQISERYGEGYRNVYENTQDKATRDAVEVPKVFAELWGLDEIVASGMMSAIDAEEAMAKEYQLFESWFGSSGEPAKRREAAKRWLSHQQDVYAEKKGIRRPKMAFPHHPHGWV